LLEASELAGAERTLASVQPQPDKPSPRLAAAEFCKNFRRVIPFWIWILKQFFGRLSLPKSRDFGFWILKALAIACFKDPCVENIFQKGFSCLGNFGRAVGGTGVNSKKEQ
jgi:hypothetical protein